MTPQQKAELKRETATRLRKPFTDSLEMLARCRKYLHSLDPKDPKNADPRGWLFFSAKSWVSEARASRFALEAVAPDSTNDRCEAVNKLLPAVAA